MIAVILVFVFQANDPNSNITTNEKNTLQTKESDTVEPEISDTMETELTSSQEATTEPGELASPEDIHLQDLTGKGTKFSFTYQNETFSAVYFDDSWHITDSYKITNRNDIIIICQALIEVHPIPGSDGESYRTKEDMTYEWQQHNFAYSILPEGSNWKESAKDVDLDPEDQGKNLIEMYQKRKH